MVDFTKLQEAKDTVPDLRQKIKACRACPLHQETVNGPTPGWGRKTGIVFLARNPGTHEDEVSGHPLSGPSGELLTKLSLPIMGLTWQDVYRLNVVNCHTFMNEEPEMEHTQTCTELHLWAHLEALQPYLVVAFGSLSTYVLTGMSSVMEARGFLFKSKRGFYVIPAIHPSAALHDRTGRVRRRVIMDAQEVRRFLTHKDHYIKTLREESNE